MKRAERPSSIQYSVYNRSSATSWPGRDPATFPPDSAARSTITDPAFIAEAERLNIEIGEISGEKLQAILADAFSTPPDIVKAANEAMNMAGGAGGGHGHGELADADAVGGMLQGGEFLEGVVWHRRREGARVRGA